MVGTRLVLPGSQLDGENIYALMDTYKVTISTGEALLCRADVLSSAALCCVVQCSAELCCVELK
jgi:hypothetical protein